MATNEIVYSQSEQIGLPNYSNINLLVSTKGSVALGSEEAGYDHLHAIVNAFITERAERIAKALNLAFNSEHEERERVVAGQLHPNPESLFVNNAVECTFSMNETIDMTRVKGETCNAKLMASSKVTWQANAIEQGLAYSADMVAAQMGQKRTAVMSNPRAWINNR